MTDVVTLHADITTVEADAIVNAANSSLMGGGGVDGAIHAAAGPAILEECRAIVAETGPCATGDAVITTAGDLPARHVIHTVGPVWGTVPEDQAIDLLASCYRKSLDLARDAGCRSVAFPNISTGVYHFPKPLAAKTAVRAVRDWIRSNPDSIDVVAFVCFDQENEELYEELIAG